MPNSVGVLLSPQSTSHTTHMDTNTHSVSWSVIPRFFAKFIALFYASIPSFIISFCLETSTFSCRFGKCVLSFAIQQTPLGNLSWLKQDELDVLVQQTFRAYTYPYMVFITLYWKAWQSCVFYEIVGFMKVGNECSLCWWIQWLM